MPTGAIIGCGRRQRSILLQRANNYAIAWHYQQCSVMIHRMWDEIVASTAALLVAVI